MAHLKMKIISATLAVIAIYALYRWISIHSSNSIKSLDSIAEDYQRLSRESTSAWLNYNDTCYIYIYQGGGKANSKVAAFDMDDTLIKPISNPNFPRNATDWEYLSEITRSRIAQETERGEKARFLVFSNQHEVRIGILTLDDVQKRIELMVEGIGIPSITFIALEVDEFLKPSPGMFRLFERFFKGPVEIDYGQSFFCGDANGYPAFSDSDLRFAQAVGLPFITPNDFLLGKSPKLVEPS